ncbi:hypothetical protein [Dysgonomonas sp. 520]|uniref:hypothetical protein n=1 Tax=Dysgonomonas sp. 520 TaxID=2302931 RepID=UPI0013D30661|nr:hypothetical protein [Dysgonomonas sp. 520]NDW08937.1 hypothetical protein [Dysgonomonas sp. 520]
MNLFKKILLFLFGIFLIAFGNREAIDTLVNGGAENKDTEPTNSVENGEGVKQEPISSNESSNGGETTVEPDKTEDATATE